MTVNMSDIQKWLSAEPEEDLTKVAGDTSANVGAGESEGELMGKLAEQIDKEQFEKMAQNAWDYGEIMGLAFVDTLEKLALEEVDPRIAGEINESVQGDPPMTHQAIEDKKMRENVVEPILQKILNRKITEGASVSGEVIEPGADVSSFEAPPAPSSGDVSADQTLKKKVASEKRAAARELLKKYMGK
jgi:hypothetical protein